MTKAHPELCLRPRRNPHLKRPTHEHPVLGTLEYVNQDGGWWQSETRIAGEFVRLDFQQDGRISPAALDFASEMLLWVQSDERDVRYYVAEQLARGNFTSNFKDSHDEKLDDLSVLDSLRPCMIILWDDRAELRYECDSLPNGKLFGADCIEVRINESKLPQHVFLLSRWDDNRAKMLLDRPLPDDAREFENTIPDQFVSRIAAPGSIKFDDALQRLLDRAIDEVDNLTRGQSPECASYMRTVKVLLMDVAKAADEKP